MNIEQIKLMIMDVDGVLTDGKIIITEDDEEIKEYYVQDGTAIKYLLRAGLECAIITGRSTPVVLKRAKQLGIQHIFQGAKNKIEPYDELKKLLDIRDEQICYIGDDLPDIPLLRRVGFAVAPANAVAEVKRIAHYVTRKIGGYGAVREVVELILKYQYKWDSIISRYYS